MHKYINKENRNFTYTSSKKKEAQKTNKRRYIAEPLRLYQTLLQFRSTEFNWTDQVISHPMIVTYPRTVFIPWQEALDELFALHSKQLLDKL